MYEGQMYDVWWVFVNKKKSPKGTLFITYRRERATTVHTSHVPS